MSTTAVKVSPETKAAVDQAKQTLHSHKKRLEATLNAVPEDKLHHSPSPTSKSALRIAAHAAMSNKTFAKIIRQDPIPEIPREEILAAMAAAEAEIETREQVLAVLAETVAEVEAALDALTDEAIVMEIPTPVFTAPMTFWMYLPARHMDNHAAQIDYIQTTWGDMDWHMG